MHDGIIFEQLGIPAASITTRPFINMGRASAAANGMPEYPFIAIEHPIGRVEDDELRRRAEEALPEVVKLLLE